MVINSVVITKCDLLSEISLGYNKKDFIYGSTAEVKTSDFLFCL